MTVWKNRFLVVLGLVCVVTITRQSAIAAGLEADLVIYNGKILTADSPDPENFSTAQAAGVGAVSSRAGAKTLPARVGFL